jgi:predicted DNA-binding ribbon-helix-helix protein
MPRSEHHRFRSSLVTHNIIVAGHRTSVRLEPVIWDALYGIARHQGSNVNDLVSDIHQRRAASSLTAAIRAYVVAYLLTKLSDPLPIRVASRPF